MEKFQYEFTKIENGCSIQGQLDRWAKKGWRFVSFYSTDYMVFERPTTILDEVPHAKAND